MTENLIRSLVRHDGWTPDKQRAFLEALAGSGSVTHAAQAAGMSRESCYRLRRSRDVPGFAEGWDAALVTATRRIADALVERAIEGEVQPVFYKGDQVGERRRYDNRLAMFLLRTHDPRRYGRQAEVHAINEIDAHAVAGRTLAISIAALAAE